MSDKNKADNPAKAPCWTLSEMFLSPDDPKIGGKMEEIGKNADEFKNTYENFSSSDPDTAVLLKILRGYEMLMSELDTLGLYSRLFLAADMTKPEARELENRVSGFSVEVRKKLLFFERELGKLLELNPDIIEHPDMIPYKHYLEKIKKRYPHLLPDREEYIIMVKDRYGIGEWSKLQARWLNTRTFEIEVEGIKKHLTYGEANALLSHFDRKTRRSAIRAIYTELGKYGDLFAAALRNICADWLEVCKLRKYSDPIDASLLINDCSYTIVENMFSVVDKNREIYPRYLGFKANVMGLNKLGCEDLKAPLFAEPIFYDWNDGIKLILEAFNSFNPEFGDIAMDMIKRNHIDAAPAYGKRNGAFCAGWYGGRTAYILQTYTGTVDDVLTLAHELGHAIHDYKMFAMQPYLNCRPPMIIAETASIFAELLVLEKLLETYSAPPNKTAILCRLLDDLGTVIFHVSARYKFERAVYKVIGEGGFLTAEDFCKMWTEARDFYFADAVGWYDELKWEWVIKPHYFMPNFRFYNYPYVFSQLFVFALYDKYKKSDDPEEFYGKFVKILELGSSVPPRMIAQLMGFDLGSDEIWNAGFDVYRRFLKEAEFSRDPDLL